MDNIYLLTKTSEYNFEIIRASRTSFCLKQNDRGISEIVCKANEWVFHSREQYKSREPGHDWHLTSQLRAKLGLLRIANYHLPEEFRKTRLPQKLEPLEIERYGFRYTMTKNFFSFVCIDPDSDTYCGKTEVFPVTDYLLPNRGRIPTSGAG